MNGSFSAKFRLRICLAMPAFEDGDRGFWKSLEKMEEGVGAEFHAELYRCSYL